ncbi:MAG: tyrosine-type recombinase/integrase, partial [Dissulfurimicrobium sp.]
MKLHLTKTTVERLEPPTEGRLEIFDDKLPGFGVRISPAKKTYFVMGRVDHRLVRVNIGSS